jgi:NDP-sugar pyrophosphorylase family protein
LPLRVFIPTAGTGSRLEEKTKFINKSLIEVDNKPVISFIINSFPDNAEFVVALGHKGDLVREYLTLAYPKKKFIFKKIKPYSGKNSGLGITLLQCKKLLQKPFVFISCDTIISQKINNIDSNWIGYSYSKDSTQYRTLRIKKNLALSLYEKLHNKASKNAYIGLAGIKDYKIFWSELSRYKDKAKIQGEVLGLKAIMKTKCLKAKKFNWHDIGNLNSYKVVQKKFLNKKKPNILPKLNESIWFEGDFVIKFSDDKRFISRRLKRSKIIKNFVPNIISFGKNMFKYRYVHGKVVSSILTIDLFNKLLSRLKDLWVRKNLNKKQTEIFIKNCYKFYFLKTKKRIKQFFLSSKKNDKENYINGVKIPKLSILIKKVKWSKFTRGIPGSFHGDLHFENIIYNKSKKKFTFLDWRQDFENDLRVGDIYYDLAKLMHGIIVRHEHVVSNNFKISWKKNHINFSIPQSKIYRETLRFYEKWLSKNGYDLSKVRILTSLIFLNISCLHHYPYSLFLFALGKSMLFKELQRNDNNYYHLKERYKINQKNIGL